MHRALQLFNGVAAFFAPPMLRVRRFLASAKIPAVAAVMALSSLAIEASAANVYGAPALQALNIGGGSGTPVVAVTADFNNDGYPDVAILKNTGNGTGGLSIYTGDAIGNLTLAHDYGSLNLGVVSWGPAANVMTAADVNGDGKIDLVIADWAGVAVLLGVGDPSASFVAANPMRPPLSTTGANALSVIVTDINHDGKPDIVALVRNGSSHYVEILFGTGGGKFVSGISYDVGDAYHLAMAKVDADAEPDLMLTGYSSGGLGSSYFLMKGIGNGLFLPTTKVLDVQNTAGYGDDSQLVDLDGNGTIDLVMTSIFGGGVWWSKGNGDGTFSAPTRLYATGIPSNGGRDMGQTVIADVNGDGLLDVVSDGYVLLQQPNHSFVFNQHIGYSVTWMLVGLDINHDGRADVITAGPGAGQIAVFKTQTGAASKVTATGSPQSTVFSTAFAKPLSITVTDAANFAVPNVQVMFAVPFGVGVASATPYSGLTDAQGKVSYTPVANGVLGCYQVKGAVTGIAAPLTFDLCNTGANDLTAIAASDNQTTLVSTAFTNPLQVKLTNAANTPLPGVMVTFTAPGSWSSATLSATTAVTDASGIASVSATANAFSGSYNVVATAPGATPTAIKLSNSSPAGSATSLNVDANTPQWAYVTKPFSGPIIVNVNDFWGNPVAGATVVFQLTPDAQTGATATFSALTAVSNAAGKAQVSATANGLVGHYFMKVSIQGSPAASPKTFSLNNYADLPAFMALTSGNPQSTDVNTSFAQKLRVKVTNSSNAATPQVRVYFVASGGATLSSVSALADANGFAEVTATADNTVGSYQVGAIVYDTSTEAPIMQLFSLTNTAPAVPSGVAGIPTLSEWGLIVLSGLLAFGSFVSLRRQHR